MFHHLSLVNCTRVKSRVTILFQSIWPQLRHLNLLKSELSEADLEVLSLACNGPGKTLPNLTSLFLSIPNGITDLNASLFGLQWSNLNFLYVDYPISNLDIHTCLCEAMKDGKLEYLTYLAIQLRSVNQHLSMELFCLEKLQNLETLYLRGLHSAAEVPMSALLGVTELGIYSWDGMTGNFSKLFCHHLPLLKTLILCDCKLDSQDLHSLADANVNSRLPNLKHLDLSENGIVLSDFMHLFDHQCTWNHLLSLNIMNGTHDNEAGYSNEADRILL